MRELALWLLGIILSFGGGWYTANRFSKKPRLVFYRTSELVLQSLGGDAPLSIKITHNRKPIRNLLKTKVALWNSGTEPFVKTDISAADPLRIHLGQSQFLAKAGPLGSTVAVAPQVYGENDLYLSFDCLNQGEAIAVVIYSDIKDEDFEDDSIGRIRGSIKGLPGGALEIKVIPEQKRFQVFDTIFAIMVLVGIALVCRVIISFTKYEAVASQWVKPLNHQSLSDWGKVALGIIFGPACIVLGLLAIIEVVRTWRRRPPPFVYDELLLKD